MIRRRDPEQPTERDLAALADGSLEPERRELVETAVAASPELQRALSEQRYALAAVHSASVERAPAGLRARVALERPSRRRPARRIALVAAAGLAVIAAAVAITLGGGSAGSPTVADAATLATRAPLAPVPTAARGASTLTSPSAAGMHFPYWQDNFGWKAIGSRTDRLRGRSATTVFYRQRSEVVAYTILSGRALRPGATGRAAARGGKAFRSLHVHGRNVVTWLRAGHTCVLSGGSTAHATLLRLAAWRGDRLEL
ncbi:MAG: anti-sigma factor family protein [Thermoleophilaceae bacterium]